MGLRPLSACISILTMPMTKHRLHDSISEGECSGVHLEVAQVTFRGTIGTCVLTVSRHDLKGGEQ